MGRMQRGWRSYWILIWILIVVGQVQAANYLPNQVKWLTYYSSDEVDHGLWVYDPVAQEKYLLTNEIGDQYKFSPDGRHLAFLVNNHDRGQKVANTLSLWVRDLKLGTEYAVVSDFDTDRNLDAIFDWLATGELVVIQSTPTGYQTIKLFSAAGELLWTNPINSQYITHNDQSVLLGRRPQHNLTLYNFHQQQYQEVPVYRLVLNGSLSPQGTYFCYQTFKEIILINLDNGERNYIDVGEVNGVTFDWSQNEKYLIYQVQKRHGDVQEFYLNVFNVQTSIKEFEVSSNQSIPYSWSDDEDQMAFGLFQESWDLYVWFPNRYQISTIQRHLAETPVPVYLRKSHEFVYLRHEEGAPLVQAYDVDQNRFQVLLNGPAHAQWSQIGLVAPVSHPQIIEKERMYWAGWSQVKEIQMLKSISALSTQRETDGELVERYHQIFKWSPKARVLALKEDEQTLALVNDLGEKQVIYQGHRIDEPFWDHTGGTIGFIDKKDEPELFQYHIFQGQMYRSSLVNSFPAEKQLVGWWENHLWFYDGKVNSYSPLRDEWQEMADWKSFWWPKPKITPAHYLAEGLWQLGGNLWMARIEGDFRVLTRFPAYLPGGWQVEEISAPSWSPDDEEIGYQQYLVRNRQSEESLQAQGVAADSKGESVAGAEQVPEEKWEIWTMNRFGTGQRYVADGVNPQWWGNHQLLFLRNGDIYQANLVTGQVIGYRTEELWEQAFTLSYDGSILAVVALDEEDTAGLYYYILQ